MHRLPRSGTSTVIKHYMLNLFGLLAFGNADSWISFYNIFTLTTINLAIENLLNNRYNLSVDFSPKFFPSFSHSLNFFVQLALIGPINRHVSLFKSNDDDYGNENATKQSAGFTSENNCSALALCISAHFPLVLHKTTT